MQVSKAFLQDFAYLANRYGWTAADIEEMKAAVGVNEGAGRRYITTLAAAHRAGYEQTQGNGYIRLDAWCALKGWSGLSVPVIEAPCSQQLSPSLKVSLHNHLKDQHEKSRQSIAVSDESQDGG